MNTKIIAAFPGTGKSHFVAKLGQSNKAVDLDTNDYTQGYDENGKAVNKEFPENYLSTIKKAIGRTDMLFVGCQPEVLNLLREEGISIILIYPERKLKEEYISRFRKRGDSQAFSGLLSDNWDRFLDYLETQDGKRFVLREGQYIEDIIKVS